MSLNNCWNIEINGTIYPFYFGMGIVNKFSKSRKWDKDPAVEVALRLLTIAGSQADQSDFHKLAAAAGAAMQGEGVKPPKDNEIEDNLFKIVNITQTEVYPSLMDEMGIDVRPMITKMKKAFNPDQVKQDEPEKS